MNLLQLYNFNPSQQMQSEPHSNYCLLCCQQSEIFIIPKCNHKHICWKCCMKLIKAGRFECPFCKQGHHQNEKIIFVNLQEMNNYNYIDMLSSKNSPIELLKSQKNSNFYYSNVQIAEKIQYETSYTCPICEQSDCLFKSLNELKKHLDQKHSKQYCDICLLNRKCIQSQQILYSAVQYQKHLTSGELTQNGDLILYHPKCDFCRQHFYDIDEFKRHLEKEHQKCHICHKNAEELKYVYYRDYEQTIEHFKKSHFYCQTGNCMHTKFQNVFVTEQALNEHIQRVHKKSKKFDQPIMNIVLGFNKNQNEQVFQWDKVGKNYLQIFQMVQKHANISKLQPVEHGDGLIDIRDFYPEQCRKNSSLSLHRIKEIIENKIYDIGYRNQEIFVSDIEFFKPLEMTPVTRIDLEKFINAVFQPKTANPIISNFFQGRQNFKSPTQYFGFIHSKMLSYHKIAYYYAFPQLVRFFKNENPHKSAMQEYYYESLRQLKVKKAFIIHSKSKYSQVLKIMKKIIQNQMQERFIESVFDSSSDKKQLDLQKYEIFLKDLNSSHYIQNQQDIFYVSKDKMTNLYHMIHRCRLKDFLKMNWLLKIGFNNQAYKVIQKDFYYKEEKECQNAMKKLTVQELGYLYAYCTVCLQAIFQKILFKQNKQRSHPLFLSYVMSNFQYKNINPNLYDKYRSILKALMDKENKSLNLEYHVIENKNKGVIINEKDYESLLSYNDKNKKTKIQAKKKNQYNELVSFGTQIPKVWDQGNSSIVQDKKKTKEVEEYPSILTDTKKQLKKWQKKQQQDFPVFHFVGKNNKKKVTTGVSLNELNSSIGWANKGYVPNQWNEQKSKKTWDKRLEDEERRIKKQKQLQVQKNRIEEVSVKKKIVENLITEGKKKIQHPVNVEENKQKIQPVIEPMIITKGKKSNLIDEQKFTETKKKGKKIKKVKQQAQQKQSDQEEGIFGKIQKESNRMNNQKEKQKKKQNKNISFNKKQNQEEISFKSKKQIISEQPQFLPQKSQFPSLGPVKPIVKVETKKQTISKQQIIQPKKKKIKTRLDDTSSQQQKKQHKKSQQFKTISQQFINKEQKMSKVNQIIQAAKVEEQPENLIKIKKGRNGKKVIVERVNLFAL